MLNLRALISFCFVVLRENLRKKVKKYNDWKKQVAEKGEGSDKEMDAYERYTSSPSPVEAFCLSAFCFS